MSIPDPIAQGDLESRPFAHLLLYLEQHSLSGTLAIWPDPAKAGEQAGQDRILFIEGKPTAARWQRGSSSLEAGILRVFGRTGGPYAFYAADLVSDLENVVHGRLDTFALFAAGSRGESVREDAVDLVLKRFGDKRLRLKQGVNLGRYRFEPKEDAFVQVLRAAPGTVEELARISGSPRLAKRVLYVLALTQSVETYEGGTVTASRSSAGTITAQGIPAQPAQRFGSVVAQNPALPPRGNSVVARNPSQSQMPSASGVMRSPSVRAGAGPSLTPSAPPPSTKVEGVPAPPREMAKELKERWRAIGEKATKIEKQNYFAMLGVRKDVQTAEVSDAYMKLVKDWHPDRLPAELGELKPWMERIFHHITTAKDILSDEQKRAEHVKAVEAGGGTPETDRQVNAIIFAALEYQKVEVLVKQKSWDEALPILEQAKTMNPGEADYFAMEAWILLNKHSGPSAPLPKILESCDKALAINEAHERANFCKGLVLKRLGDEVKAHKFFKKAMEINPRNIEAAREVRIATMRGTSIPPKKGGGGLFGLFKGGDNKKK